MNPRLLLVSGVIAAGIVGASSVSASASKQPAPTTTIARLSAKASLPEPVAVVSALDDEDGDGVSDSVAASQPQPSAPPVSANGWRCPVVGGKFTNDYGAPRSGGRSHAGTDILAPRGTPVFAPVAGTVKFDSSSLGGLSFYLDTPSGLQLYGAHLSAYGATGPVESGAIIGYVGDSGNARGTPHLHFEVHPSKKTKTNPFPLLKQIC